MSLSVLGRVCVTIARGRVCRNKKRSIFALRPVWVCVVAKTWMSLVSAFLAFACGGEPPPAEIEQSVTAPHPVFEVPTDTGLKLMSYNILHGALGLQGIADQINAQAPDVVHLQEVDVGASRSGRLDQPAELAKMTGLNHHAFDPVLDFNDGGQYGTAFLSRYPFEVVMSHLLPPSHHDRRLFVIDLPDPSNADRVHRIGGTHLSFDPQYQQAQVLSLLLACHEASVSAVMGDFNITPQNPLYSWIQLLYQDAWVIAETQTPTTGLTFPATQPTARIDYVFVKEGAIHHAEVPNTQASDHRPVVARWAR